PQQPRPESHTPNATPAQKDTHHHSRPDQALLVKVLLLHRHQLHADVVAGIRAALAAGVFH
ncbi:hypothetical protein, partial [Streptomyces sp. NPDC001275]